MMTKYLKNKGIHFRMIITIVIRLIKKMIARTILIDSTKKIR